MPFMNPLAEYRQRTKLSSSALAEKLGVNRGTLWRWEVGKTPVPVDRFSKIETETGLKREQLRPDIFCEKPGVGQ
jgi:DNA-binding transcriptional regulator YdaS (Cro superfamily)